MIRANYESDAGKRKFVPHKEMGTIPHVPFEEYSEMLKHCFMMKRGKRYSGSKAAYRRRQYAVGRTRASGAAYLFRFGRT